MEGEGTEPVVRADPRERLGWDVALKRRFPNRKAEHQADTCEEGADGDERGRRGGREEEERQREQALHPGQDKERSARPRAHGQDAADQRPDALEGEDGAPHGGSTEVAFGDARAKRGPGAPEHVGEREVGDDRPHPAAGAERDPALAQVVQERGRLALVTRRRAEPRQAHRADRERRGIHGDRPAGAGGRDERARDGWAEDLATRERRRAQRVRGLELLLGDELREQPGRGGVEAPGGGPGDPGERGEHPDLGVAADHQRSHHALARHADDVGTEHQRTPRRPVRDDTAEQNRQHERRPARREHESNVGGRPAQVDHREGQRHHNHAVAEHGHALGHEQQPEIAAAEDLEVLPEPHRQRRYMGFEMIQVRSRPYAVLRASAR